MKIDIDTDREMFCDACGQRIAPEEPKIIWGDRWDVHYSSGPDQFFVIVHRDCPPAK